MESGIDKALGSSKSSETWAAHLNVPVPPLFRSNSRNSDTLTDTKSTAASDDNQSSPGNDEPKLRRASKDGSGSDTPAAEGRPGNCGEESAKNDVVAGRSESTSSSTCGQCLENDVTRLSMNESLRYEAGVNLHEFSLVAGNNGLAASEQHRRNRRHHHHHHHHQEQ